MIKSLSSWLGLRFISNPYNNLVTYIDAPVSAHHELTENQPNEIQRLQKLKIYLPTYFYCSFIVLNLQQSANLLWTLLLQKKQVPNSLEPLLWTLQELDGFWHPDDFSSESWNILLLL